MNAADIRRLRKKFIGIAMLSLFLVMIFIVTAINLSVYFFTLSSVHKRLDGLSEQPVQEQMHNFSAPSMDDIFSPQLSNNLFYVFVFKEDGSYTVRTNTPEKVSEEVISRAEILQSGNKGFGREGSYYYQKTTNADGSYTIVLLNCESELSMIYRILFLSLTIFVIVLMGMFLLIYRLSAYAIRPEIENNRRQKEFITNASHELKTPLAVIRANTELLEMTAGENEWTQSTLAQVDRIDGLIKNLVMIAKSDEKANAEEKAVPFNVSVAVEQTTDTYIAVATQQEKSLVKQIEANLSMIGNEGKIRQLATILLDNAMKYCDEKGTITVSLSKGKKETMTLAVSNDYKDGATVDYTRFFDRFYRQDTSHNIDKGGYGIGLSIAENICKEYRGEISAKWENGVITFTCALRG